MKTRRLLRVMTAVMFALWPAIASAQNPFHGKTWPRTDFGSFLVDPGEIFTNGAPKDGLPAIEAPVMGPAGEDTVLAAREGVITLALPGTRARAYPLRYLMRHVAVNDTVGGRPILVSYSGLSEATMVYDRRLADGTVPVFGVSGLLRHSNALLFDRQSESWWQQANGRAIVGAHAGERLHALPAWVESWDSFRRDHPDGLVMSEPAQWDYPYGETMFPGYEKAGTPPYFNGPPPPHGVPSLVRVVRVGQRAWPLPRLMGYRRITEAGYVLSWRPGMASNHDTRVIAEGRDIGMVRVRDADGKDVPHDVMFAFSFHALWPEGRWMLGQGCSDDDPGHPC